MDYETSSSQLRGRAADHSVPAPTFITPHNIASKYARPLTVSADAMKPKKSDEKLGTSRHFEQKWLHIMRRPPVASPPNIPLGYIQNMTPSDKVEQSMPSPISPSGDSLSSEQTVKFLRSRQSRSPVPQDTFHFASDSSDNSDSDDHIQESNDTLKTSRSHSPLSIKTATHLSESGGDPLESTILPPSPIPVLKKAEKSPRSRADSRSSKISAASHMSASGGDEALRKRLGKLAFWNRSASQDYSYEQPYITTNKPASLNSHQSLSHNRQNRLHSNSVGSSNKVFLGPPITVPPKKRGGSVASATSYASTGADTDTVPFPAKRESSNGSSSFNDLPRLFFDSEVRNRRRKTEESGVRSRSSSLGLNYHSYAHHQRQAPSASNGPMAQLGSVSGTPSVTGCPSSTGVGCQDCSGTVSNRPPALLRTASNEDVRFRRVLPLPPPPTIGTGNVMDDPDVKALHLDPMAVRYAELLHMLGYTRNRYVCALLSRESSKDGSRYNGMVMQAFIMRMLRFHGEPLDMSLRKFLFKMALAQESQQIERQLQSFSILWNYQNPGFFTDEEHVLCVVYSLVMLHTATFNKNVKQKMSKADFVRNAPIDGVAPEIFEYFYDNITATSFKAEDENAISVTPPVSTSSPFTGGTSTTINQQFAAPFASPMVSTRSPSMSSNQDFSGEDLLPPHIGQLAGSSHESPYTTTSSNNGEDSLSLGSRRSSSFIWSREQSTDPYPYLLENRLDSLRAALPGVSVNSRLKFCALEAAEDLHMIRTQLEDYSGVSLQIASGRSKIDAQETQRPSGNFSNSPSGDHDGSGPKPALVNIPVVKHGVVLRREYKRTLGVGELKPAWREWGLILTTSKLYFFKNPTWIRQLDESARKVPVSYDTLHSTKAVSTRDVAALVKVVQNATPRTSQSSSTGGHSAYSMAATSAVSPTAGVENLNKIGSGSSPSSVNVRPRRTTSSPPASTEVSLPNTSNVPHLEVGPHGTEVFDFMLVEGGRDTAQQCFAVRAEDELISWVRSINVIATQSSLNIGLLPSLPASAEQVKSAIDDVNDQIEAAKSDVASYQRTLEHFQMLAPLHHRTRERLVFTAGRYTSRLDDSLTEIARLEAYSNILSFMQYT